MFPYVYIFGRQVAVYSLCALAGIFAVFLCGRRIAPRRGLRPEDMPVLALLCVIPALIGGSLLYGLTNLPYLQSVLAARASYADFSSFFWDAAAAFEGLVFYGGMLAVVLTVFIYARVRKQPVGGYLDVLAVCIPLFHAFGRIGCFCAGCCFGVACPIGFTFTSSPNVFANDVTRFPVQLLECACNVIIFLVLLRMFGKRRFEGELLYVYFLAYGSVRFLDEFLRGDSYRGFLGPLSTSQWISLVLIAVALWKLYGRRSLPVRQAQK